MGAPMGGGPAVVTMTTGEDNSGVLRVLGAVTTTTTVEPLPHAAGLRRATTETMKMIVGHRRGDMEVGSGIPKVIPKLRKEAGKSVGRRPARAAATTTTAGAARQKARLAADLRRAVAVRMTTGAIAVPALAARASMGAGSAMRAATPKPLGEAGKIAIEI